MTSYGSDMKGLRNLEAEQALLGCLMFDPDRDAPVWPLVEGVVRGDQFSEPFYGKLFVACAKALSAGQIADPVTLQSRFREDAAYQQMGGLPHLLDLIDRAPPSFAARDYAETIADLATLRALVALAHGLIADAKTMDGKPADSVILRTEDQLRNVIKGSSGADAWVSGDVLANHIDDRLSGRSKPSYVLSGYHGFDKAFGGFRKGRVTVVAARPSMGKSAFAVEIMRKMAQSGLSVGMFSLEMDEEELALRMGCGAAYHPSARANPVYFDIERGEVNEEAGEALAHGARLLRDLPIYFDTREDATPRQVLAASQRLIRRCERDGRPVGALIIDHLHIMEADDPLPNRAVEVGQIIGALRRLARKTDVPVIVLAQLSRAGENRSVTDKRPQLSDLNWSGSIEQDANTVHFLYRPEYYLREPQDKTDVDAMIAYEEEREKWRNVLQILNGKNRGGARGGEHEMLISLAHNALRERER